MRNFKLSALTVAGFKPPAAASNLLFRSFFFGPSRDAQDEKFRVRGVRADENGRMTRDGRQKTLVLQSLHHEIFGLRKVTKKRTRAPRQRLGLQRPAQSPPQVIHQPQHSGSADYEPSDSWTACFEQYVEGEREETTKNSGERKQDGQK